jgi:hypothetical protein
MVWGGWWWVWWAGCAVWVKGCVCECVKGWCVGEGVVAGGGWRAMGPRSVEVGVGWWVGFRELGWVRDSLNNTWCTLAPIASIDCNGTGSAYFIIWHFDRVQ